MRGVRGTALVLAAGSSRRMRGANKLTLEIDGVAVIARVVDAALASSAREVIVVTGWEAQAVARALTGRAVRFVHNAAHASGIGASIASGVRALSPEAECAWIALGDMPCLEAHHFDALAERLDPTRGSTICVPVHAGRRGHPVLFAACHFPELAALQGDQGARALLEPHAAAVAELVQPDAAVTRDVDTPEQIARLRALPGAPRLSRA